MSPHCGRLDAHEPHEYLTHELLPRFRRVVTCPGDITTEGGGTPPCRTCGEQPAAPHGWGQCRWCWADRTEEIA